MKIVNRTIACALIVSVIGLGMPSSSLAGIVATDEARGNIKRDQVTSFLERSDVRDRMQVLLFGHMHFGLDCSSDGQRYGIRLALDASSTTCAGDEGGDRMRYRVIDLADMSYTVRALKL